MSETEISSVAGQVTGSTVKRFVLLVIPTMENAYHSLQDFVAIPPPIGIASIAACVEQTGREALIVDGDAERLTLDQAVDKVVALRPDYVGSTVMTATMDITRDFYARVKSRLPAVPVIVGGPHVSALPERTLEDASAIDVSVIGEGDETVVELLAAMDAGVGLEQVAGIAFRQEGRVVRTARRGPVENLATLPRPAFHLLNKALYRSYGWNNWVSGYRRPFGVVFTGRGCVGKCNFCAAHTVFGRGIRYFELQQIKDQLDFLVNDWNIRVLYFLDDTFTANRKMVHDICDYLIEKGYHRRLEIMVSSRVDTIHLPTLQKMRQAGVRWICFGVESGNQELLTRMQKRISIDQIRSAFRLSREAGLFIAGNFMIGHLGETRESALDTIRLACELDQDYASFAVAIPLPGTELYDHCVETGIPLPPWNDFGNVNTPPIPLNASLDAATLVGLRAQAIGRFFKRPGYFFGLLVRMRAGRVILDFARMYLAILREKAAKRF